MSAGSHAETGDERNAPAALLPHVIGQLQTAAGCGTSDQAAKSDCPRADRPFASMSGRVHARGFGMLWLTALTFSMMKEAEGADPNVIFLDDGGITYKDLEHGTFELVTKEPIPRHFFVEDPGETFILRAEGSSVSVSRVINSSARMAELQAAQQDALATLAKGMGSSGSSTPPLVDQLSVQPINFIETEGIPAQNSLTPLPFVSPAAIFEIRVAPPPPPAPTLKAVTGPTEIDTSAFDHFTATSGTFVASSANSNATLTYGISGGTTGSTVLDGTAYDVSKAGAYGTLYVNSTTGAYTFVPNSDAINALTEPTTTNFMVTVSDGTLEADQTFTIAINGVNDAAIISGAATGSAVEAGGVANAAPGLPTATGILTDTDVDNTPNTFTPVSSPTPSAGGHGTFTMSADGVWAYTVDETDSAVQALNVGDTLIDRFTVTTVDGTARVVTVTIHGANDAAVISGATAGAVIEAGDPNGAANAAQGTPSVTGTLTDTDVDNTPNSFTPVNSPTASAGGHGTYTMTAAGVWTYTLDDCDRAVQALNVGDTLTDTFKVTTIDGTAQVVTVTIHGTNDAAVISGTTIGSVTEAGYHEHGKPVACGQLTDTDVDNTPNTFTPVSSPAVSEGGYGSFTMTADGLWTYTLDNTNGAVQALNSCDTLTDCFKVTTIDGTAQVVTITIHGTNDAAIISGTTTGSVVEAGYHEHGQPIACGTLTDTDVDNAPNSFTPVCWPTVSEGGYGSFTMTADGLWTYRLDNANCAVQELNSCDTLTDCFKVTTIDGTAQVVTVTIHGTNDAAVISGTTTGSVVEAACDDPGKPIACGQLADTDVDNTPNSFAPVCWPTVSEGGYGSFTMTADGLWTYRLDNANCAVQELNSCDTLTDCFKVTTIDGTAQVVTIAIHGSNDPAIISGITTGSVVEAGCDDPGKPIACGTLTDTDVDNTPNSFTPVCWPTVSEGGYGSFTMTADGVWTYRLDNANCAVQALDSCDTLTDCFKVTTIDGTAQVVKITIYGTSDGFDFETSAHDTFGSGDSFRFNDGISGNGSGATSFADLDFAAAPISLREAAEGAQAIDLSLSGQYAADVPEPVANAVALHAPHDLML